MGTSSSFPFFPSTSPSTITSAQYSLQFTLAPSRLVMLYTVSRHANAPAVSSATSTTELALLFTDRRIVRATGHWVHSDILGKVLSLFALGSFNGHGITAFPIISTDVQSIAINATETRLLVSSGNRSITHRNMLLMFSLDYHDYGKVLFTIGDGYGYDNGRFAMNRCACFASNDNVVVSDWITGRVQEFTSTGEFKRAIATPLLTAPHAIAVNHSGTLIAVGTFPNSDTGVIVLMDYQHDDGKPLRKLQHDMLRTGVLHITFSPDDEFIAAATMCRGVHLFNVHNRSFVRTVLPTSRIFGVAWTDSNDIIALDMLSSAVNVVCVSDDDSNRIWPREVTGLIKPLALCASTSHLYIVDKTDHTVRVFV